MSDLDLLQRCFKQDKPAWDEFVDKYSRLIYKYIHGVLRLKGSAQAEPETISELYQEIFLSLIEENFKKLKTFKAKNGASLATWLRQITVNRTIDYLRKYRPTKSIDEEDDEGFSLLDLLSGNSALPAEKISEEEIFASLKECIGKLDKQEKYFLRLHIDKGVRLEDLKEHFGLSRAAVDMRKSRIVDKLRECFRKKGFSVT